MPRKQMLALFICSLFPWIMGNGLLPLLPVYAVDLGASSAVAGYYLAVSYLALAAGALSAGWISARFQRQKPLWIACLLGIPINLWLSRAGSLAELALATACLWFLGGLGLALINIIAGLYAPQGKRGRTFGILGLAAGLGSIIGGFLTGPLAEYWGYSGLFSTFACLSVLWFISSLFVEDKFIRSVPSAAPGTVTGNQRRRMVLASPGTGFVLLLLAMFLTALANFTGLLGRSLVMDTLNFSTTAITSTAAISAIFILPVAPLVGVISDRLGRRPIMWVGYLCGALALITMAFAGAFWQFSLAIFMLSLYTAITQNIANAWTVDLVAPDVLGRGLALMGSITWFGGVFGFALGGVMIQAFGATSVLLGAAALFVLAGALLIWVRNER